MSMSHSQFPRGGSPPVSPPPPRPKSSLALLRHNSKLVVKLGLGFFADAYDLFVVDIVLAILGELYKTSSSPEEIGLTSSAKSMVASATSGGAVLGMLLFGILGDNVGRRAAVLVTGTLVAVGSVASALVQPSETFSLASQLIICRLLLGVGIGGEYPLSATMASESCPASERGRVVAGVFSMQGVGMLASAALAIIFLSLGMSLELSWRLLLGIGALPALGALYFRLKMTESSALVAERERRNQEISAASGSSGPSSTALEKAKYTLNILRQQAWLLAGTCLAWFLLDVTFYGTGEFKHAVAEEIFVDEGDISSRDKVLDGAYFSLIVAGIALPGYLCACAFIDKLGRWRMQVGGFIMMIACYLVMALTFGSASKEINLVVFGLTFFFTNFGPNATTFIIPSEIFPPLVRATCHGISAAMGKAGAIIGAAGFPPLVDSAGLGGVLYTCAGVACLGLIATLVFLPRDIVDAVAREARGVGRLEREEPVGKPYAKSEASTLEESEPKRQDASMES